jgi:hypothetical protein
MRTSTPPRGQKLGALLAAPLMAATLAVGGLGLVTATAAPVQADRSCSGTLKDTTIDGNVQVPRGATCIMYGVRVKGDIQVAHGGTIRFSSGTVEGNVQGVSSPHTLSVYNATVDGDVQGTNARYVKVQGSTIDGNVQTERTRTGQHVVTSRVGGDVQSKYTNTRVDKNRVGGNVQHEEGRHLSLRDNTIGGDAQVFKNRYWQRIYSNRIEGNLQCKENSTRPVGQGNTVRGSKEDQCRNL